MSTVSLVTMVIVVTNVSLGHHCYGIIISSSVNVACVLTLRYVQCSMNYIVELLANH